MNSIRTLAAALAIAGLAVPAAQARPIDTPDPIAEAPAPSESGPKDYSMNSATGDYSPPAAQPGSGGSDSGDAATGPGGSNGSQDLRAPDTVDAANGRGTHSAPQITVVRVPTSTPVSPPSGGGIDWADAGIGAGGMLAMIVVAGGGTIALLRRRQPLHPAA